ncbi:MAG TPA: flagellar protein FlgN [Nocardioidaceae bacterium]|nr:flagellar protein FlgN [Nocardioidaceae bacterium]
MSIEELSSVLWRERELFEMLLFKLEEEQLVLAGGRTQWLAYAAREVETVLEGIRETEVLRAVTADAVAESLGLAHNPSLNALAEAIGEPWRSILLDHRETFVTVMAQITEMASTNRELLTSGYQSARETLLSLADGAETYGPDGSAVVAGRRTRLVDRSG